VEDVPIATLSDDERLTLQRVAIESINQFVYTGQALRIDPGAFPPALRAQRATFVTLHIDKKLRGCIGSVEARRPLVSDVAASAVAAATRDPRFPPVTIAEIPLLELHISILTPPEPMTFADEEDLLRQLKPGVDGLILEDGRSRGTFLPAVWETVPQPREFLRHLKMKAGLRPDHWAPTVRVSRYRVESIP